MFIHADLVSLHSKPLDRMINGHMAEAQAGVATLEDVDDATFDRFIQWAYTGYYSPADFSIIIEPEEREDPEEKEQCSPVEDSLAAADVDSRTVRNPPDDAFSSPHPDDGWGAARPGTTLPTKKKTKGISQSSRPSKRVSRDSMKVAFSNRETSVRQDTIQTPALRPNENCEEEYTDVFLSHARLHVFAEKYGILPLKVLALENLQITLAGFDLYTKRTGDIVELLRYIYECVGTVPGMKDLRDLMTEYMGYEMDTLMKDKNFKDLMIEDGGKMLGDFMKMLRKRI